MPLFPLGPLTWPRMAGHSVFLQQTGGLAMGHHEAPAHHGCPPVGWSALTAGHPGVPEESRTLVLVPC